MIRLLLLDADGTLVGANGVHARAWEGLDRARAAGLRLAFCTGRPGMGTSLDLARRVDSEGLHVFQSGAVISKPGEPAAFVRPLPRETFRALVEISRRERVGFEAYGERRAFLERHTDLTRRHAEVLGIEPEVVDLLAIDEPIVRTQWVVPEAGWPRLRALSEPLPGLSLHPGTGPWAPGAIFGNMIEAHTSKASALRWLTAHHGLEPGEVAMVGDGENDLGAMRAAGFAIAMGNSPDTVKQEADAVVGDVEDGALAEAIDLVLAAAREGAR